METGLKEAVPLLLGWYKDARRDLPWRRGERTPYSVLVSELMLQQTRAEAVKERYGRFLARFPTAEALAAASVEEVLKEWEGLGYYSRARSLHRAAKEIAAKGFPRTWEGVKALPGVGEYTAGAISSIALGLPVPAVDGNVLRILSRFFADPSPVDDAEVLRRDRALLKEVYPPQTGDFAEALMDLGATVCVPNGAPLCGACPWAGLCEAHRRGEEGRYPVRSEKKKRKTVTADVLVLVSNGKYAIEKRDEHGLLAGMYGFPFFEGGRVPESLGAVRAVKSARHIFTHIEWRMTGYLVDVPPEVAGALRYIWATPEEIRTRYAIPSAFKAFAEWVE